MRANNRKSKRKKNKRTRSKKSWVRERETRSERNVEKKRQENGSMGGELDRGRSRWRIEYSSCHGI